MKTKTLLAGLAAGVASFFSGWFIFGMALDGYMKENTNQIMSLNMDQFNFAALFLGSLVWGMLYAIILSWANANSLISGLMKGALVGFLFALSLDLNIFSMTTMYNNTTVIFVDVIANTVSGAIVGAIVGLILGIGRGSSTKA